MGPAPTDRRFALGGGGSDPAAGGGGSSGRVRLQAVDRAVQRAPKSAARHQAAKKPPYARRHAR
jgi:hypothetical protein